MRDMDLSMMLEQGPIRESFLPHLSRADLQNIGQTNFANRTAVYTHRPIKPLQLPPKANPVRGGRLLTWEQNGRMGTYGGYPQIENPAYVREVRSIASGQHPDFYPHQLSQAGINPNEIRHLEPFYYEAQELQRVAGTTPFAESLADHPLFLEDLLWRHRNQLAQRANVMRM